MTRKTVSAFTSLCLAMPLIVQADAPASLLLRYSPVQGAASIVEVKPHQYNNQTAVLAKNAGGSAANVRPFIQARDPSLFGALTGTIEALMVPLDQVESIEWQAKPSGGGHFRVRDRRGAQIDKGEIKLVVCPAGLEQPSQKQCDAASSPVYTMWVAGEKAGQFEGRGGVIGLEGFFTAGDLQRQGPTGRLEGVDQFQLRSELAAAQAAAQARANARRAAADLQAKADEVIERERAREAGQRRAAFMKQAALGTQVVCNSRQRRGETIADLLYTCHQPDAWGSFAEFQAAGWRVSSQTLVPESDDIGLAGHRATLIFEKVR